MEWTNILPTELPKGDVEAEDWYGNKLTGKLKFFTKGMPALLADGTRVRDSICCIGNDEEAHVNFMQVVRRYHVLQ